MLKVFISHAWEDNEFARRLATQLRKDGVEVWLYFTQLKDRDYPLELFEEAIEDCDIFLLIWSRNAAASRNVLAEWRMASELKKVVLSCLLDDTRQRNQFSSFLFVRFNDFEHGYDNLRDLLNLNHQQPPRKVDDLEPQPAPTILPISYKLREQGQQLTEDQVIRFIKQYDFFDMKRNDTGKGMARQFEIIVHNGDGMVFDPATNLLWQQSGSAESMWFDETQTWLKTLNQKSYGGFRDWRLPTLEEAMSLMFHENVHGNLYLDPAFDRRQLSIWTADTSEKQMRAWVVFFNYGCCHLNYYDFNNFIRAVRSDN